MRIQQVKISDLQLADYNPRSMTKKEFDDLKKSIEQFGFVSPILVNENRDRFNVIIGGHARVAVAKEIGLEEVPAVYVDLTFEKEQELNIRLNRNQGHWDWEMLANMSPASLESFGFPLHQLDHHFDLNLGPTDQPKPPITNCKSLGCRKCMLTLLDEDEKAQVLAIYERAKQRRSETKIT